MANAPPGNQGPDGRQPRAGAELSQVLDQMEEEHERILAEATPPAPVAAAQALLELHLNLSAGSVRDLRKLLAGLHELDGVSRASAQTAATGGWSGSLGATSSNCGWPGAGCQHALNPPLPDMTPAPEHFNFSCPVFLPITLERCRGCCRPKARPPWTR
jgi:hypothetical protein